MAAPTVTTRQSHTGRLLRCGYKVLIAFARKPAIKFEELTVTPPGIEGGDAIPQTTQHNDGWHTDAPRVLKRLTNTSITVAWDPKCYDEILDLVNQEGAITARLPDGSTLTFFGYLKSFIPGGMSEDGRPEANIEVIATNWDPTNNVIAGPVFVEVAGT